MIDSIPEWIERDNYESRHDPADWWGEDEGDDE